MTASQRVGLLHPLEEEMIHRALELTDVSVREIMVPRPDIFSLPADMSLEDAMTRIVEEQHSRVPVNDPKRGPERIIGVLYAKELMRWMHVRHTSNGETPWGRFAPIKIRNIMRDVLVVPETKSISDLLADFKHNRRHLAVVVDEFGSTVGVVTVEDVLEQLVGEMEDEFDVATAPITLTGGAMMLEGSTNIRDLETQYQIVLPRDEGFETLAGFVMSRLQRIPRQGDSFEYENHRFTVTVMEGNRVAQIKLEAIDRRKSHRVEASNF